MWKAHGLGHADVGCRSSQFLFGLDDVRSSLEQLGRQPRRNLRWNGLFSEHPSPGNCGGFVAQQHADLILSLNDLAFQIGQLCRCAFPFRHEPVKVELRDVPFLITEA